MDTSAVQKQTQQASGEDERVPLSQIFKADELGYEGNLCHLGVWYAKGDPSKEFQEEDQVTQLGWANANGNS